MKKQKKNPSAPGALRREVARIESAFGSEVKVMRPDWADLMKSGVLVQLHIGRWRARRQLTSRELGLPEPKSAEERDIFTSLFQLGTKRLLPAKIMRELDAIESAARKDIAKSAHRTYWGLFVTIGRYAECRLRIDKYRSKFLGVRDYLRQNWKNILSQVEAQYRYAAAQAYHRLNRLNPRSLQDDKGNKVTEKEFATAAWLSIREFIPGIEEIYRSFTFDLELSYIPLPDILAKSIAEQARVERANERERTANDEKLRALRQMNEDVVRTARAQKDILIQQFLADTKRSALAILRDGFQAVETSVGKNNQMLVGKAAELIRNTITMYRQMELTPDENIENQLTALSAMMANKPGERDLAAIKVSLRALKTQSASQIKNIDRELPERLSVGRFDEFASTLDDSAPDSLRRADTELEFDSIQVGDADA